MTASGGNFIGSEVNRNKRSPQWGAAPIEVADRLLFVSCSAETKRAVPCVLICSLLRIQKKKNLYLRREHIMIFSDHFETAPFLIVYSNLTLNFLGRV